MAIYFRYKDLISIKCFASLKRTKLSCCITAYTRGIETLRKPTGHRNP